MAANQHPWGPTMWTSGPLVQLVVPSGCMRSLVLQAPFGIPREGGLSSTNSIVSFPSGDTQSSAHTSGFVDLRRVHSLYIHSSSFAAYNSLGPRGVRTIVAKVPVSVVYGGLVTFTSSEWCDCYLKHSATIEGCCRRDLVVEQHSLVLHAFIRTVSK